MSFKLLIARAAPSPLHGNGLFAVTEMQAGERLEIESEASPYENRGMNNLDDGNLACVPHARSGHGHHFALNDIKQGDELTINHKANRAFLDLRHCDRVPKGEEQKFIGYWKFLTKLDGDDFYEMLIDLCSQP